MEFVFAYRIGIECEKECKTILTGEKWRRLMSFSTLDQFCVSMSGTERDSVNELF